MVLAGIYKWVNLESGNCESGAESYIVGVKPVYYLKMF